MESYLLPSKISPMPMLEKSSMSLCRKSGGSLRQRSESADRERLVADHVCQKCCNFFHFSVNRKVFSFTCTRDIKRLHGLLCRKMTFLRRWMKSSMPCTKERMRKEILFLQMVENLATILELSWQKLVTVTGVRSLYNFSWTGLKFVHSTVHVCDKSFI